jgi:nucleotide-binding universal stress UspA family protein
MDIKQILLVQPADGGGEEAEIAGWLAREHGATVAGACLYVEPDMAPADNFAEGHAAVADVLQRRRQAVGQLCAPAADVFRNAITSHGMSDGWEAGGIDSWIDRLTERARLVDLVVGPSVGAQPGLRPLLEALVLQSGAPCLLAPRGSRSRAFKRIALAWNGSREAKRAMADALPLLKAAPHVAVVIVDDEPTRRVDARQSEALIRHLARHGVSAATLRRTGDKDAGQALIDACDSFGADLLVMGAYGRSRAAEVILGGATRTLLAHAKAPTLLSH